MLLAAPTRASLLSAKFAPFVRLTPLNSLLFTLLVLIMYLSMYSVVTWRKDIECKDIEEAINGAAPGKLSVESVTQVIMRDMRPFLGLESLWFVCCSCRCRALSIPTSRPNGDATFTYSRWIQNKVWT